MEAYQRWIVKNISADFRRALELSKKQSLSDPEQEPFKSLFAARKLLCGIQHKLNSCELSSSSNDENGQYLRLLNACVCLQLGVNYVEGEETSSGQKELEACLAHLDGVSDKSKATSVAVDCYNNLGILWGNRDDHQKALDSLLKAKGAYEERKQHLCGDGSSPAPMSAEQWLLGDPGSEGDRAELLEDLHTHTLFYLAQVYGQTEDPYLSARYCRSTLGRQLHAARFDGVEWSLNCATLSQYYLGDSNFVQARHCLACSALVLRRLNSEGVIGSAAAPLLSGYEVTASPPSGNNDDLADKLRRTEADLSRCWCKYAISLLQASGKRAGGDCGDDLVQSSEVFRFETLDVADLESSVTAEPVKDYESAKAVFLFGQKHVNAAKQYYTKDAFASDFVSLIQDHSSLFNWLVCFEPSDAVKCRMHKRRVNLLAGILRDINVHHYLLQSRQLMQELADTYSEMADLKIVIASDSPSADQIAKINKLITQSVNSYRNFCDTFVDAKTGALHDTDDDNKRSFLRARFHMARLLTKTITPDPAAQIPQLQEALVHYKWIVEYCDSSHLDKSNVFRDELPLCREMVALLPTRIAVLRR